MTDLNLTPEEQFILACLRTEFSGSSEADFAAFDLESFDWNRVYNKSLQWRIAPLLYKIIEKRLKSPVKHVLVETGTCPRGNGEGDPGGCLPIKTRPRGNGDTSSWKRGGDSGGCHPLTNCPPLAGVGGGVPESPLIKGDSGGCHPLDPVVSAQSNEKKTVPLWRGQGEDLGGLLSPAGGGSRGWKYKSPLVKGDQGGCQKPDIPKAFLEKLKVEYLITRVANDAIYKDLAEISEVFKKAGIKFILLKGSHLAQFVYQDIGVRPMGDIDILVKKDALQKAEELLLQMGYTHPIDTKSTLHLPYFSHPEKIKSLEVHWTITKPIWQFNIDIEGLWERAKTERMNGIDILIFSPEDLLLYLSLHATCQHKLSTLGLVPYCDIATIIDHDNHEFDLDKLQARAHEWGIAKYLYLSLRLSHEILGVSVPDCILCVIKSKLMNEKIISEAKNRILSIQAEKSIFSDIPHLFYEDLHPNNSFIKRIFFVFQRTFISPKDLADYYALPAKSIRIYLYYVIRIVSLLYRFMLYYARFIFYRLTHKKEQVYGENLDLWLLTSNSKKGKITRES